MPAGNVGDSAIERETIVSAVPEATRPSAVSTFSTSIAGSRRSPWALARSRSWRRVGSSQPA